MNNSQNRKYGIRHDPPALTQKVPKKYPWLSEDRHCDVCVVGGGLTGALCALAAAESERSVVLVTSGEIGFGQTAYMPGSASSDGGRTLTELDKVMSMDDALTLYTLGFEALDDLQNLCGRLDGNISAKSAGISTGFERRDSVLFTRDSTELELLEREFIARSKKCPDCTFITRKTAANTFAFDMYGGILTKQGGAALDPYLLTHLCLMKSEELGAEIFEHTEASDIETPRNDDGCVIINTSTHRTIYADRLIFAAGGEGIRAMIGRGRRYRTLTAIYGPSGPTDTQAGWSGKCLLRTFGRPVTDFVIRPDGSIAASATFGRGITEYIPLIGNGDLLRYDTLKEKIRHLVPGENDADIRYEYSLGHFGTSDGLPVIGVHGHYKNCIFALCGGGMSPVYSQIAAKAVNAILNENSAQNINLFDPMRFF